MIYYCISDILILKNLDMVITGRLRSGHKLSVTDKNRKECSSLLCDFTNREETHRGIRMHWRVGNISVEVIQGDIADIAADAIVNAANSDLWMGSGVAGAIKRKGGRVIEQEAMAQGPIRPGEAVITTGGDLRASHVIHCAGMAPGQPAREEYVQASVEMALDLLRVNNLKSVGIPVIGAGIGGLTAEQSIRAIIEGIRNKANLGQEQQVFIVGYTRDAYETLCNVLEHELG
jgi:O-acetyl-ADP-ribose deacetylase (regulator of RNase III)